MNVYHLKHQSTIVQRIIYDKKIEYMKTVTFGTCSNVYICE